MIGRIPKTLLEPVYDEWQRSAFAVASGCTEKIVHCWEIAADYLEQFQGVSKKIISFFVPSEFIRVFGLGLGVLLVNFSLFPYAASHFLVEGLLVLIDIPALIYLLKKTAQNIPKTHQDSLEEAIKIYNIQNPKKVILVNGNYKK